MRTTILATLLLAACQPVDIGLTPAVEARLAPDQPDQPDQPEHDICVDFDRRLVELADSGYQNTHARMILMAQHERLAAHGFTTPEHYRLETSNNAYFDGQGAYGWHGMAYGPNPMAAIVPTPQAAAALFQLFDHCLD